MDKELEMDFDESDEVREIEADNDEYLRECRESDWVDSL